MSEVIFYSWQSDLPNATNRGFIKSALEKAAAAIRNDTSIEDAPRVTHDTEGIPGAPEIPSTIFSRIESANVVVCDVSLINPDCGNRRTPNPNVLVELGYALRACTSERVIMVMNTHYGDMQSLPFDLSRRRVISYEAREDEADRSEVKRELAKKLEVAIRIVLDHDRLNQDEQAALVLTEPLPLDSAIQAVADGSIRQDAAVRSYLLWLAEQIQHRWPVQPDGREVDEQFVEVLKGTEELVAGCARLCKVIAEMNAVRAAREFYREFGAIVRLYNPPVGFSGSYSETQFCLAKFLGHELFVVFIASMMEIHRWELLGDLLSLKIFIDNYPNHHGNMNEFWCISDVVQLLQSRANRMYPGRSLGQFVHSEAIRERHEVSATVELRAFTEADIFLAMRSISTANIDDSLPWRPWSARVSQSRPAQYLAECESRRTAEMVAAALGCEGIEELRQLIRKANVVLNRYVFSFIPKTSPLADIDLQGLGARE